MSKKHLGLLIALYLAGCVSQIKKDVVLERSSDRAPDWAAEQTFERDGNLFLVGEGTDTEGYALAGRVAKAMAAQSLAEAVGLKMKSELTRSIQRLGVQSSGSFVQDTIAMATELVTVQDLAQDSSYREKIQLAETGAVRYHVVSLYKLPAAEFRAAKRRALEAMQGQATKSQDYRAMESAKKLLDEVKQQ